MGHECVGESFVREVADPKSLEASDASGFKEALTAQAVSISVSKIVVSSFLGGISDGPQSRAKVGSRMIAKGRSADTNSVGDRAAMKAE